MYQVAIYARRSRSTRVNILGTTPIVNRPFVDCSSIAQTDVERFWLIAVASFARGKPVALRCRGKVHPSRPFTPGRARRRCGPALADAMSSDPPHLR
jgi:hypothetical protein